MIPGQAQQFFEAAAAQSGGGDVEVLRSLRFNSEDTSYLNRTPSSATNRRTYTFSCWVKRSQITSENNIFHANSSSWFRFESSQKIYFWYDGSNSVYTDAVFRDPSAWYHLVLAVDTTQATASDRVKIYVNGVQQTLSGTQPTQNFDTGFNNNIVHYIGSQGASSSNALNGYLANVQFIDGQAKAASDFGQYDGNNVWQPKAYSGSYGTNGFYLKFDDNSSDAALGTDSSGNNNTWTVNNLSATAPDALIIPASEVTTSGSVTGPLNLFDGNVNTDISSSDGSRIYWTPTSNITVTKFEVYFTSQYNGYKIGIEITNGNSQIITKDTSGSGNSPGWVEFTSITGTIGPSNQVMFRSYRSNDTDPGILGISAVRVNDDIVTTSSLVYDIDSVLDTPAGYTADSGNNGGNYATYDAAARVYSSNGGVGQSGSYSNGNLVSTGQGVWSFGMSSIAIPSSGKWYCEMKGQGQTHGGIACFPQVLDQVVRNSATSNSVDYSSSGTITRHIAGGSSSVVASSLSNWNNGATLGVAVNADDGEIKFYVDGSLQYTYSLPAALVTVLSEGRMHFMSDVYYGTDSVGVNFGQQGFIYTPPTNHIALCTQSLPDPTISDSSTAMDVVTYTGNSTARNITGFSMAPDVVWIKKRSGSGNHSLADTVRGATKNLVPNDTQAEGTEPTYVTAFNSDGFSLGASSIVNNNGDTYVSWSWDAGSSNSTITAGSLNSSFYDQSAVWSNMCSPAPSINSYVQGFDGNLTTTFAGGISAGSYFTFTPTGGGITFSDKVRVYNGNVANASYKYNGGSAQTFTANAWNTVATGGGTMTSFGVTRSGTDVHGWYAIEVDGKILVDQGLTPPSVPALDSTVRANTTSGFSIVSWTGNGTSGARIGHGLNATPEMVIFKNRDTSPTNWRVYNTMTDGSLDFLYLNTTGAKTDSGLSTFTSTTFTAGSSNDTNGNGDEMIAYCFAPVAGYSAFGSYAANTSTNGPGVYTGFRPRWIMIKASSSAGDMSYASWLIVDTERDTYNVSDAGLFSNNTAAEGTRGDGSGTAGTWLDILSNGFKIRYQGTEVNGTAGQTYIYAAFAEHPFKTARAR